MSRIAARVAWGGMAVAVTMGAGFLPGVAYSVDGAPPVDASAAADPTSDAPDAGGPIETIEIVSKVKRLNETRSGIQTQTGASVYTLDQAAINAMPGGDNT